MDNVADFIKYRNVAVSMFPVLAKYPLITTDNGSAKYMGFNVAGIPTYNVPPGFDMNANQDTYRTGFHEPGHELEDYLSKKDPSKAHRSAFYKFFGMAGSWDADVAANTPYNWSNDPGEMWADAFADAVAGDIKVCKRHFQLGTPDPVALRAFFLNFIAPQPGTGPDVVPVNLKGRLMYDSTTAADIPTAVADVVAGYVDGDNAWSDADFAKFNVPVVRICIYNNRFDADVIDIEAGNNNADGAVPWIKGKWERGDTPVVYCYTDLGPEGYRISDVRDACDKAEVKRPKFIVAEWDGNPTTFDPSGDPDIVGKQFANQTMTGGHFDVSIVSFDFPFKKGATPVATGPDYITREEFEAFKAELANTDKAEKDRLAIDAHHTHDSIVGLPFKTSEPK